MAESISVFRLLPNQRSPGTLARGPYTPYAPFPGMVVRGFGRLPAFVTPDDLRFPRSDAMSAAEKKLSGNV